MNNPPLSSHEQHQKIAKSVSIMGVSLAITMLISLILRIMMPRILGPEKLGIFYFAESFANLFFGFLPLGIGTYIFRRIPARPDHTGEIFPSILLLQLLTALVIAGLFCFALFRGNYDVETRQATLIMGVYAAIFIFQKNILQGVFIALERVKLISQLNVLVKIVLVGGCLLVLYWQPSVTLLACMFLFSELCGLVILMVEAKRNRFFTHPPSLTQLAPVLKVSLPFYLASVLNGVYAEIDTTLLTHLANHSEVGYFGTAYKLIGVFLMFIPLLNSSISPTLSRAYAQNDGSFQVLVGHILHFFLVISLPLSLGIILFGDTIATLLYGPSFAPSFKVLAFLSPVLVMMYLNTFMGICLNFVSSGHKLALIFLVGIVMNISLDFILIPIGLARGGAGYAAQYVSFSTFICEAFAFCCMAWIFPFRIWSRDLLLRALGIFVPCWIGMLYYEPLLALDWYWRLALVPLIPLYAFSFRLLTLAECRRVLAIIKAQRGRRAV